MKQILFDENTGTFKTAEWLCLRPTHDPPYPRCIEQCKVCFELDAQMESSLMRPGEKQ